MKRTGRTLNDSNAAESQICGAKPCVSLYTEGTLSKQKVTYLKQCSLIAVDVNVNRRTSYSLHSIILPVTKKHYFPAVQSFS